MPLMARATDGRASVVDDTGLPGAEFALVFPAGSSESIRCFTVPIVNDTLLEGTHDIFITVADAGPHARISPSSSVTTVTIMEGDIGRVSLESLSLEFSESNGSVAVCAVINGLPAGGLGTDVDLSFGIVSASAVEGEDFVVSSPISQTFSSGSTGNGDVVCIGISIVDDDIYEAAQEFIVNITSVSPPSAVIMGTPGSTTATIQDNQDAVVVFVMDEYAVNENEGAVSVCVDSGVTEGFQTDLTVSLSATDGTASFIDDTELLAAEFTLVFPAGSTNGTRCTSIPITDDELLEGNHEFTVTLTGAGSHASIDTLSSVTTVTIIDDENMATITLGLDSPVCSEGDGSVDVCAVISGLPAGGLGTDIAVDFNVTGDSAVVGEDFSVVSSVTMVFSSSGDIINGDGVCITVSILEDDIYEENQDFAVRITVNAQPSAAVVGTPDSITKTIQDNEDAVVGFTMDEYMVNENEGAVSVCVDSGVTEGFGTRE
jgi:hypothetical protein